LPFRSAGIGHTGHSDATLLRQKYHGGDEADRAREREGASPLCQDHLAWFSPMTGSNGYFLRQLLAIAASRVSS
jgi:hypothetical protein